MPPYPVQETVGCAEDCPCRTLAARHDPRCACGLYAIGEGCPYCTSSVAFNAAKERTKQEMLEEYDRRVMAAAARVPLVNPPRQHTEGAESCAPNALPATGKEPSRLSHPNESALASASTALDGDGSPAPRPKGRRQKPKAVNKRTSAQVARAKDREERERRGRAFWNEIGTAVEGVEQDMEEFMASLKSDANSNDAA